MSGHIEIVYVGDARGGRADALADAAADSPTPVSVTVVEEGAFVNDELSQSDVDCVVSEHALPGLSGLEVLHLVRDADPTIPFVLFVADGSEELASDAISAGVTDYVRRTDDSEADVERLAAVVLDEATSYRAEQDVAMLNDLARNVYERVTDGFMAVDRNWQITYLNAQAEDILATQAEDLVGENIWQVFPDAIGSTFYTEYHRAMATQSSVTFTEYFAPLDRTFDVRAFPSEDGLSVHFQQVTEGDTAGGDDHLLELTNILSYDLLDSIEAARSSIEAARETCDGDAPELDEAAASLDRMADLVNHSMRLANDR